MRTNDADERGVRVIHEPLLWFLFLWHCHAVHIYWDFCLGQAMTAQSPQRKREREREKL